MDILSKRGKISYDWEDSFQENLCTCNSNPFHEENNVKGYINLGTEVNEICYDLIKHKLNDIWICDFYSLGYKDSNTSTKRLRSAIAKIMTEFLESYEPISDDNLFCFSGVTGCIDMLCHSLANPGDVFLVPTPMYCRAYKVCMQRSNVDLFPIHMIEEYGDGNPSLTLEKITEAYKSAVITDNVVRGILLTNPNVPLGDIYSPEFLMDVMAFCSEKNIHLIVNEAYALSTYFQSEKFHSVLKFSRIPNPNTTHVVYGLSKDFSVAGLRIGVIHTKCKQLQEVLMKCLYLYTIPYPVLESVADLLEDSQWCKEYVREYQARLTETRKICVSFLHEFGVRVKNSSAGYFLWIDLRQLCGSSFDGERNLTKFLLDDFHLYIGPGEEVFCLQPGWFRIAFTRNSDYVSNGLKRLIEGLKKYKTYEPPSREEASTDYTDSDY